MARSPAHRKTAQVHNETHGACQVEDQAERVQPADGQAPSSDSAPASRSGRSPPGELELFFRMDAAAVEHARAKRRPKCLKLYPDRLPTQHEHAREIRD